MIGSEGPTTLRLMSVGLLIGLLRQVVYGTLLIAPALSQDLGVPGWLIGVLALGPMALGAKLVGRFQPHRSRRARAVAVTATAAAPMALVATLDARWLVLTALALASFLTCGETLAMSVTTDRMGGGDAFRLERSAELWMWQGVTLFVAGPVIEVGVEPYWGWRGVYAGIAVLLVVIAVLLWCALPSEPAPGAAPVKRPRQAPVSSRTLLLVGIISAASGYGMNVYDSFLPLAAHDRGVKGVGWTQLTFLTGCIAVWLCCRRRRNGRSFAPERLVLGASLVMLAAFAASVLGALLGAADGIGFLIVEGVARQFAEASSSGHSAMLLALYGGTVAGMSALGFSKALGQGLALVAGALLGAAVGDLARYESVVLTGLGVAAIQVAATLVLLRVRRADIARAAPPAPARRNAPAAAPEEARPLALLRLGAPSTHTECGERAVAIVELPAGGLGEAGFAAANRLAERGRFEVVLVSATRSQWPTQWLSGRAGNDFATENPVLASEHPVVRVTVGDAQTHAYVPAALVEAVLPADEPERYAEELAAAYLEAWPWLGFVAVCWPCG